MYQDTYSTSFKATHAVGGIRPERHEHDWVFKITLQSQTLEPPGIIVDYFELVKLVNAILPHHQHLNDCFDFEPTAENLARHFFERLKPQIAALHSVTVGEFESFVCTYTPN